MRLAMLLIAVVACAGCYHGWSWSVDVRLGADSDPVYAGDQVGLVAVITTHHTSASISSQAWSMASAPGGFTLIDQGSSAQATFAVAGTYVIRYSVDYWTDDGYRHSQSKLLYVNVLAPVPG